MSNSKFQAPISISEAIGHIEDGDYLLPAIQRKFVWKTEQIERLFDSIMRGYPINSFMLWHVTDKKIKEDFKAHPTFRVMRQSCRA